MSFRHRASIAALAVLVLFASTAFSSVAFTSTSVDRTATVSVATDGGALLSLVDGHPDSGLVEQTAAGTIEVDFGLGGGAGATEDARFVFGRPGSPASNHAFRILNRGTQPRSVDLSYELAGSDGGDESANVEFAFSLDAGADGTVDATRRISEEDAGATFPSVGPDDVVYVVLTVDTRGLGSGTDLSGRLSVSAGD